MGARARDIVRREAVSPEVVASLASLDPLIARLYAARDVRSTDEVDHALARLRPFDGLLGLDRAVDILEAALVHSQRMLIIGDFDADGATSTAVAMRALRAFGAEHVDYLVPNRFDYGYGLTPEIVDVAARGQPDVIITVDNGISSHEGVARAQALGIRVVITDHHLPPETLPRADAIVNPNQLGDNSGLGTLAGVGVIFYVMLALRARLRTRQWFSDARPAPNLGGLLDLVATGTVADVAALDANNRVLVAQGLARIRRGRAQPGIRALLQIAGRRADRASAADLAFAVGPRLNAAGRLTDMRLGIECLLCEEAEKGFEWAERLDALNRERRLLETTMTDEARAQISRLELGSAQVLPSGVCLFDERWHPGIVGIIAARVKEDIHRPVIAFAVESNGRLKGSGRSVAGVHIRDAIDAVTVAQPKLVERFGGHAMAAGLTLRREHYEVFANAFAEQVAARLTDDTRGGSWLSDGPLSGAEIQLEVAARIRDAGPWGQGFPEPLFDGEFEVIECRVVGGKHTKLRLGLLDEPREVDAIAFNFDGATLPVGVRVHLVYRLEVNYFRGQERLQLVVEYVRVADTHAVV